MRESELITKKKAEFLNREMKDFIVSVGWTHKIQITQSELYEKSANKTRTFKILTASLTSAGIASFIFQILPNYKKYTTFYNLRLVIIINLYRIL